MLTNLILRHYNKQLHLYISCTTVQSVHTRRYYNKSSRLVEFQYDKAQSTGKLNLHNADKFSQGGNQGYN